MNFLVAQLIVFVVSFFGGVVVFLVGGLVGCGFFSFPETFIL